MKESEANEFMSITKAMIDNYGRRPMLPETMAMWFEIFKPFTMQQYRMACQQHLIDSPAEIPTAGLLMERLRGKDYSRPGAEEAWSTAVKACDESETVMMTDEIAQAWGIAQPIFNLGDEVGARMAFKECYARLTASPEAPAKWWPSIGSDPHKRDLALSEAKRAGLLPAPQVSALLPPPVPTPGNSSPEGLKRLKEVMAGLQLKSEASVSGAEEARKAEQQRKADIAARVAEYSKDEK